MKNFKKTLSVILAVLMLACVLPLFASAADPIKLLQDDPLVKIEFPTVSPTTFDYGLAYGDLSIEGGAIYYDGVKVEGSFVWNDYAELVVDVLPGETNYVPFYFKATDPAYREYNFFYPFDDSFPDWPVLNVNPVPVTVEGSFPEVTVISGTKLSKVPIPETVNVYNGKTGEEITKGKWQWYTADDVKISTSTILSEDIEYSIRWYYANHEKYYTTIKIKVINDGYIGLGTAPTAIAPTTYTHGMTMGDIALEGGTAYYDGAIIPGHYEWVKPGVKIIDSLGKSKTSTVKFVPDDSTLAAAYESLTTSVTVTLPEKLDILVSDSFTEITKEYKTIYNSSARGDQVGLILEGGELEPKNVEVKFIEGIAHNSPCGVYENVKLKLTATGDEAAAYNEKELTVTVKIVPAKTDKAYGVLEVKDASWSTDKAEGEQAISLWFNDDGKTGTVTVKVNGEIVAEGIEPTYKLGESQKIKYIKYIPQKSGTYTVTAEYIPGENDSLAFAETVLTVVFDVVLREERKITVAGGDIYQKAYYFGDRATVEFTGNSDNFDRWEFTDASGKVLTAADLSNNELTLNDSDFGKTKITFIVPDYDITVTAKNKSIIDIPTVPGGDGIDFAAIWSSIVQFFADLRDLPVISDIIGFFEMVINFFKDIFGNIVA